MKKIKIVDLASFLTICGVLLYLFGWLYWSSFYNELNIDSSFISIPFEKLLATTWSYVFLAMGFYCGALLLFYNSKNDDKFSFVYTLFTIVIPIITVLSMTNVISILWYSILMFITILISVVIHLVLRYFKKDEYIVPYTVFKYILFVCIFITLVFFYSYLGKKQAKDYRNKFTENIEVIFNDSDEKYNGMFIAIMDNRYFVLVKDKVDFTTIIIESNVVNRIRVINTDKKTRVLTPAKPQ